MTSGTTDNISREMALRMVREAERAFGAADITAILGIFTDDVVIRFAEIPEIRGKVDAERFLRARFARQRNYKLSKSLRMVEIDRVGNVWDGEWDDAQTGQKMRGRGIEFWTVRDGKIALWEAAFNVWQDGRAPVSPIL
ncbi:MAG: nuclear transport factor 2 family protein [Terracidiphilus sp.]|jgi:nuclear transport factor 2 (NTF2) superfamily protein